MMNGFYNRLNEGKKIIYSEPFYFLIPFFFLLKNNVLRSYQNDFFFKTRTQKIHRLFMMIM